MIIYVQWAKTTPEDYFAIDLNKQSVLNRVQKKLEPTGNEVLDNNPGWINSVNCQGVVFEGYDHYAFKVNSANDIDITAWNDDPIDYGTTRFAITYNFKDPAPDASLGGKTNTVQTTTAYGTPDINFPNMRPWNEFVTPPASSTWHGIWLSSTLYNSLVDAQTIRGWREWIK